MRSSLNRAILWSSLAAAVVGATVVVAASTAAAAAAPVGLGTAGSFAVLAGAGVTNTGPSLISGNLGTCPTPAVTGFPPGLVTGGSIHAADATACGAQSNLTTAYNDAAGRAPTTTYSGPTNLGGTTLVAGVYRSPTSLSITGTLTLDGQGDGNSVFIFQAGSTLITAPNSQVSFVNGSQACNVFWKVGSSATLGVGSTMAGSILALTSITANTNARVQGRLLARNGAVTLDSNRVSRPGCVTTPTTTTSTSTTLAPTTTTGPTTTVAGPTTTLSPTTIVGPTTTLAGPTTTAAGPTTTIAGPTSTIAPLAVTTTTTMPDNPGVPPVVGTPPLVPLAAPTSPVVTPGAPAVTPASPVVTPAAPAVTPAAPAPAITPAAARPITVSPYAPIVVAPKATARSAPAPAANTAVLSTPTVGNPATVDAGAPTAGELPRTGGAIWWQAIAGLVALGGGALMRRWAS